jgi:hypothetical protein
VSVISLELSEPVLALMAAVFGGAGLKIIEGILARGSRKSDLARELRDELRQDVQSLRVEIESMRARMAIVSREYYVLYEAFNELAALAAGAGLAREVRRLRDAVERTKD